MIENFSPRVMANLGLEWPDVHAANPAAVMTRMPAFGLDGPWRDRTGFAQTMEQASGMAWMTGEADGPPIIPRGVCDPIAGLHAVFATLVALVERERTGEGMLVESTMVEAVLNVAAEAAVEYSAYGQVLRRGGNRGPLAAPQGAYRCSGDDAWIALAVTDDVQWSALRELLGLPDEPELRTVSGRRAAHDRIDLALSAWSARHDRDSAVAALRAARVPVAPVTPSADLLGNPQLAARGFFEPVAHAVVGTHPLPGMPFTFADRTDPWLRLPPPLFGEHNEAVLGEVLGLSAAEIGALLAAGIVSRRPAGV
nr:CoA transferase [Frankia gtarii]